MPKDAFIESPAELRDVPSVDGRKAMAKEPEPARASVKANEADGGGGGR